MFTVIENKTSIFSKRQVYLKGVGDNLKVKFRGRNLDIKNEKETKREFLITWNGYLIEVNPYQKEYSSGKQKLKYEAYCVNPMGSWIVNTITCNTISEGVQECFDNISLDIDDLKSDYDEIGQWLEKVKEFI